MVTEPFLPILNLQNGSDGIGFKWKAVQFWVMKKFCDKRSSNRMTSTDIGIIEEKQCSDWTSPAGAGFTMLILRGTASSTYNAINRTVFWNADIIVVLPIAEARAKADGDITVTGVLTVSDQFAGSYSRRNRCNGQNSSWCRYSK
jgi:hypothetical protein